MPGTECGLLDAVVATDGRLPTRTAVVFAGMVIGHNHLHATLHGRFDNFDRGDAAVHGHDEHCALIDQLAHRRVIQAVTSSMRCGT